ncbi:cytosine permease [Jatrophihabitans telluris]|uniref:Cytosine permease n=1 Tax=Jatrophihabitans telluris TaxID=2038343 RepID=A0ABY4R065_9ACTN|nr:cytosine permease [Jatrophihabitans telluris]UQX89129.1 cytosine permease [Jatrophihabitans telluris]
MTLNEPAGDRTGRIEAHGIDVIPESERHGRARELLVLWAASNITYLYIVLGGTLVLLGLGVVQAMAVVLVGNLFWLLVGWLSVSGPSAGTPSEVITRAMFGVRGNRLYNLVLGWGVGVAYEAINLSVGALAGFALVEQWGGSATGTVKAIVIAITALVTFTISVYGHATIVRLSGMFSAVLLISLVLLGYFVLRHADFGYRPPVDSAVHGPALWAAAAAGFTIIASSPLSWGTGADYARYLPASTSRRAIVGWTAVGGYLPAVALGGIGVLAGTVVDMTDPQTSLSAVLPGWFYPIFLTVIVLGSITNNVLTAYSTGLALQAMGIGWTRAITVIFDAIVAVGITSYALFVNDFLDTLNNLLALTVAFLGPALAIYGVDIVLRRNRYDGSALHDETPAGQFWFRSGVNPAGAIALSAGIAAALLCARTAVFTGPIAAALDGADLSALVGPLIGGGLYWVLAPRHGGAYATAQRPTQSMQRRVRGRASSRSAEISSPQYSHQP